MTFRAWAYLLYTLTLGAVFAGIIAYYFRRGRRERVEAPKYRMLRDEGPGEGDPHDKRRI